MTELNQVNKSVSEKCPRVNGAGKEEVRHAGVVIKVSDWEKVVLAP